MNGLLLPMLLIATGDKGNQKALFSQILPAMMPGRPTERALFATISVTKHLKNQAQTEKELLTAAIQAGGLTLADVSNSPALDAAYKRLSAADQSTMPFRTTPPGSGTKSGGHG